MSGQIDVSDVVIDADFSEPLTILRSTGTYALGGFTQTTTSIGTYGIAVPAGPEEIRLVPEGEQLSGSMIFRCPVPFLLAQEASGESDLVVWGGQNYKIVHVFPWDHFGCPKGLGVLESNSAQAHP